MSGSYTLSIPEGFPKGIKDNGSFQQEVRVSLFPNKDLPFVYDPLKENDQTIPLYTLPLRSSCDDNSSPKDPEVIKRRVRQRLKEEFSQKAYGYSPIIGAINVIDLEAFQLRYDTSNRRGNSFLDDGVLLDDEVGESKGRKSPSEDIRFLHPTGFGFSDEEFQLYFCDEERSLPKNYRSLFDGFHPVNGSFLMGGNLFFVLGQGSREELENLLQGEGVNGGVYERVPKGIALGLLQIKQISSSNKRKTPIKGPMNPLASLLNNNTL